MAFILQNWGKSSVSANEPVSSGGVVLGAPREYSYYTLDTQAVVSGTANYFSAVVESLFPGDLIRVYSATDLTSISYIVTAASINPVSVVIAMGGIAVANINLTSANLLAMYGAPVLVMAAPGAGKAIIVQNWTLTMLTGPGPVVYANGGAIGLQYDATAHLAGLAASATVAATALTTGTPNNLALGYGPATFALASVLKTNVPIYISNDTAAFINGDGTAILSIQYRIVRG